jgi:hypothetical protein
MAIVANIHGILTSDIWVFLLCTMSKNAAAIDTHEIVATTPTTGAFIDTSVENIKKVVIVNHKIESFTFFEKTQKAAEDNPQTSMITSI